MQNPRGEWMVLLPYTDRMFLRGQMGTMTSMIRHDVIDWMIRHVGVNSGYDDAHPAKPWRARVWNTGEDARHCFFFYHKRDALLFKLTWA